MLLVDGILNKGRRLVDRSQNRARNWIRLHSRVDLFGAEAHLIILLLCVLFGEMVTRIGPDSSELTVDPRHQCFTLTAGRVELSVLAPNWAKHDD